MKPESADCFWYERFVAAFSARDYAALLRMAADPQAGQAVGPHGMTGLHYLPMHAPEIEETVARQLLTALIRSGVPINSVNEDRRTPLLSVQLSGTYWMIPELVAAGADPDWDGGGGNFTSLSFNSLRLDDNGEILEALVAAGANPNFRHRTSGTTPLLFAASFGHAKNLATLFRLGADSDARHYDGIGVVHELARNGHEAAIRQNAWLHPLIDQRDAKGQTPVSWAASFGQTGAIAALMDAGADPTLIDERGMSAMDFADTLSDFDIRIAAQALLLGA